VVCEGTVDAFLGEYKHSLDAKGRVILPADFRPPLAAGAVLGVGKHNCLVVYTQEGWQRVSERVQEIARNGDDEFAAARAFFAGARPVTPDGQGRVPIPENLREYAGLTRDVVVTGMSSFIEIWDAEKWREQKAQGQSTLAAAATLPGFF
jgi:MraZ protein